MTTDHHAALVLLPVVSLPEALLLYGDVTNYELQVLTFTTMSIGDVRSLIEAALLRPQTGDKKLIVVLANNIQAEAEHALLKVLEEPPTSTRFLFVLSSNATLLPTVRSRFQLISAAPKIESVSADFKRFAQLSYAERLELIAKKLLKKDTLWIEQMRSDIRSYLAQSKSAAFQKSTHSVHSYSCVLNHLGTRGAANKMLLEEFALTLPLSSPQGAQ